MERSFLSQKEGGGGGGVKEKQHGSANDTINDIVVVSSPVDELDSRNTKGMQEGNVAKIPSSSTPDPNIGAAVPINIIDSPTTDLNNTGSVLSGITSYDKLVIGKPSRKNVNFRTLITPAGNEADVDVSLEPIRVIRECSKDGLDAILENGPWFIRNNLFSLKKLESGFELTKRRCTPLILDSYTSDMCMQSWGRSSYARAMIDLRADRELKDTIVVAMPKLPCEGFSLCTIRVEYEWKSPICSSCKVFGYVLNECPKKSVSDTVLNNPRQATKGVRVGPKVSFKSTKQIYRPISNKNGANTNVEDDDDFGTNVRDLNSAGKGYLNVVHDSSSNTPIIVKIDKIERKILDGKLTFVDDDGNPLVPTGNVDSDSEVEVVFDETTNLEASTSFKCGSDRGYGTNSLLEQWRETKRDDDYDPYDDDLYESHYMSDHLQAICDDLDIMCTTKVELATLPKDSIIKFSVKNGTKPLILNYETFVIATELDYDKGKNVVHPQIEAVKTKLLWLGLHDLRNETEEPNVLVEKTQSSRFKESVTNRNKGKTFDEVELDTNPQMISKFGQFQALLEDYEEELKEFSDDEILDVGDDTDADTPKKTNESFQHPEQSPPPAPESPKPDKFPKPSKPPKSFGLPSSSHLGYKDFNNFISVIECIHKEVVASYADLRANVEEFCSESLNVKAMLDTAINTTMKFYKKQENDNYSERTSIHGNFTMGQEELRVDSEFKAR
ncbi:hypothetical protein Tco_1378989 [Tanacetum coccineum]